MIQGNVLTALATLAYLQLAPATASADSGFSYSDTMTGISGLNTVPNARMDKTGVLHTSLSRQGPYTHSFLGTQVTENVFLGLRQTALSKTFTSGTEHLYPGIDTKIRLFHERAYQPEIALGIQSAFGHKRMAAEYLALSKRYFNWDYTLGLGWGRLGSQHSMTAMAPFDLIRHNHHRVLDGENPSFPSTWFQGPMALFGGIQYNMTPNLILKADWSSDGWKVEGRSVSPLSLGLSYSILPWADIGMAWNNGNGIMARLTLSPDVSEWPAKTGVTDTKLSGNIWPEEVKPVISTNNQLSAELPIVSYASTPAQIQHAVITLARQENTSDFIGLHLSHNGLSGPDIILNRQNFEKAFILHQGSSEEIWHSTQFGNSLLPPAPYSPYFGARTGLKIDWQSDISLSEEDSGIAYRTALIPSYIKKISRYFLTEQALRINIADNLDTLNQYRSVPFFPVRSDIDRFTQNRFLVERNYIAGHATIMDDLHVALHTGYLEEMYGGTSAEILYRPFAKNWAIGAETALAFKRDPSTFLGLGFNGDHILTSHANVYYQIPESDLTVHGSFGRYLAGDVGEELGILNQFDNGVEVSVSGAITNAPDIDMYGARTNIYAGMTLTLPLGNIPFIPDGSRASIGTTPLGRNKAQRLHLPDTLYEQSEGLSYRHITRHWSQLLPSS